jgi:hypothetical protein
MKVKYFILDKGPMTTEHALLILGHLMKTLVVAVIVMKRSTSVLASPTLTPAMPSEPIQPKGKMWSSSHQTSDM